MIDSKLATDVEYWRSALAGGAPSGRPLSFMIVDPADRQDRLAQVLRQPDPVLSGQVCHAAGAAPGRTAQPQCCRRSDP
jgi:hypothetical protein